MTQTTINKWELADFENIEEKLTQATSCDEYGDLVNSLKTLKNVYVIGNGGLHYVASHMATDLSRLVFI